MTEVLARVPGYGGLSRCTIIGESATHYTLRHNAYRLKDPMLYVMFPAPDDAEREWVVYEFVRPKRKCYPIGND